MALASEWDLRLRSGAPSPRSLPRARCFQTRQEVACSSRHPGRTRDGLRTECPSAAFHGWPDRLEAAAEAPRKMQDHRTEETNPQGVLGYLLVMPSADQFACLHLRCSCPACRSPVWVGKRTVRRANCSGAMPMIRLRLPIFGKGRRAPVHAIIRLEDPEARALGPAWVGAKAADRAAPVCQERRDALQADLPGLPSLAQVSWGPASKTFLSRLTPGGT